MSNKSVTSYGGLDDIDGRDILDAKTIGRRIRQLRRAKNLSQQALADRCGVSYTYIGAVERAEKLPSLKVLVQIARSLSVGLDEILEQPKTGKEEEIEKIALRLRDADAGDIRVISGLIELYLRRINELRQKRR